MNDILFEIENVTKEFGSGDTLVRAIRGITLDIRQGEFIVILGKSGSGKSTFVSLLGGLEKPTSGYVKFQRKNLSTRSEDDLARLRRTEVGIVFQHFNLLEMMTAVENVELPLLIAKTPKSTRRPNAIRVLELVGLGHRITNYPHELSGGEKQRVGIARALINKPRLILADEPTGDLDSTTGDNIIELLQEINHDIEWQPTIIMVTHDISKIKKGMRVLTLSDGKIIDDVVFDGKDPTIFDRFGLPSEVVNEGQAGH
jgi:putative ABC transport system ATP-binding protein